MPPPARSAALLSLARLHGIQTSYYDGLGKRREASPQALQALLQAMGAPVERMEDVPGALRTARADLWSSPLEPVAVIWDGQATAIPLRLPRGAELEKLQGVLELEDGQSQRLEWDIAELPLAESLRVDGARFVVKALGLPGGLPSGYHRLRLDLDSGEAVTLIISAPQRLYASRRRTWGAFLPLYALQTQRSWGAGDFTDLRAMAGWVRDLGGSTVGTLPLLPSFLDGPVFEPSPYAAVTRQAWNEFFIDPTAAPEFGQSQEARRLVGSEEFQRQLKAVRAGRLVDYRSVMALKRQALELLAKACFSEPSRRMEMERFAVAHSHLADYARFRATMERQARTWRSWPEELRHGWLAHGSYDEEVFQYYLYAQWLAEQQIAAASNGRNGGETVGLYLDFPVGVHPDGFDVWREHASFLDGIAAGAPPDAFFTKGQDWGFPPFHPEALRIQGYAHYIQVLRHHLSHAASLRIDHVMGLHRIFCVPPGFTPDHGAYVRYREEEFYAILSLESVRHRATVVGEDLGTVPRSVREDMRRHGVSRLFVAQFELRPDSGTALSPVPRQAVASLNTHDMPPFPRFWRGIDIDDRLELGLLTKSLARAERQRLHVLQRAVQRWARERLAQSKDWEPGVQEVIQELLAALAESRAALVLVNLEDLLLEEDPQNVPGTSGEQHPNWRRKARLSLEEMRESPEVIAALQRLNILRERA